jgi:hypothetical protein
MPTFSPKRSYCMNRKFFVHINKSQNFTFSSIAFFARHFLQLFQPSRNQHLILRFLIPILNFSNFLFWLILALFAKFKGPKKLKNFVLEHVLEFNFATINGLGQPRR